MSGLDQSMWSGKVVKVEDDCFSVVLDDDKFEEEWLTLDPVPQGVRVGVNVTFYLTDELDADGDRVVRCFFSNREVVN